MDFSGANVTGLFVTATNRSNATMDVKFVWTRQDGTVGNTTTVSFVALETKTFKANDSTFTTDAGLLSWYLTVFVTNIAGVGRNSFSIDNMNFAGSIGNVGYASKSIPNLSTVVQDVEKYRVTAMSAWCQYQGSTLTDGGDAAMVLYRGGRPASMNAVWDYDTISEHPHSYSGKVKDGLYGYWEPQDTKDMHFRQTNAINAYERPYLVMSGTYSGDPGTGAINSPESILRMRVFCAYEYTSPSQLFNSLPSPVCPELIRLAALALCGEMNVMENGKHLNRLKKIVSKVGKAAAAAAKFGWDHRGTLERIGLAAAPLLA